MTNNADHHLYLYTPDLTFYPDNIQTFVQQCQEIGLLGEAHSLNDKHYYYAGESFLHMVTFMGCSPYLKVYPDHETDSDYCKIHLADADTSVSFRQADNNRGPRCPECKKLIRTFKSLWQDWQTGNEESVVQCEHCDAKTGFKELDWSKNAGLVHFYIKISNIFPKEAIPAEQLLQKLSEFSQTEWAYFYAC